VLDCPGGTQEPPLPSGLWAFKTDWLTSKFTSKISGANWARIFVLKGNTQIFWSKLDSNFCTEGKQAQFLEQIGLEFLY
jgi:hypothetical protein